jgi:hypothetical protein
MTARDPADWGLVGRVAVKMLGLGAWVWVLGQLAGQIR